MIATDLAGYPLQVPYGQLRSWDVGGAQWNSAEICQAASGSPTDHCFKWTNLDLELQAVKQAGVDDVMYTLSRTPAWAVLPTQRVDAGCNYELEGEVGACFPPSDLNADGSGPNLIWQDWVTAVATHVNDPSYLDAGHAHIHIWEPWNEFYRSDTIASYAGELSFEGTYPQMIRLTEDLRCIVTGKGIIHNFPVAGASVSCDAGAIDPQAVITTPSSDFSAATLPALKNFLYCDAGTKQDAGCTTGTAGSAAIDIINYHMYAGGVTPEAVAATLVDAGLPFLLPVDRAKPVMNGEGSWSTLSGGGNLWASDPTARAGFIPRFLASYWSAGVSYSLWYAYGSPTGDTGDLFDFDAGQLFQPEGTAWTTTYGWLAGATPLTTPFCQANNAVPTVRTCDFTRSDGGTGRLIWDTRFGPQNNKPLPTPYCASFTTPIVCGDGGYQVPPQFDAGWMDLLGQSHPFAGTVTIGANPILLMGP
jgi:hypothetical protein